MADNLIDFAGRLEELSALEAGWDGYDAPKISEKAIKTAKAIQIVPMSNGGVSIEWHAGGVDLEIDINENGHIMSICFERLT